MWWSRPKTDSWGHTTTPLQPEILFAGKPLATRRTTPGRILELVWGQTIQRIQCVCLPIWARILRMFTLYSVGVGYNALPLGCVPAWVVHVPAPFHPQNSLKSDNTPHKLLRGRF